MSEEKNRGLALSGGGFRAALFHLGVIMINNEAFEFAAINDFTRTLDELCPMLKVR